MAVTNKQQVFINEYLRDFNATRAAKAAGYSENTARSQGQRLLTIVDIAAAIREAIAERGMSAEEVLTRLAAVARGDIGEFLDVTTVGFSLNLKGAQERGLTSLIKKIKQKTTTFIAKKESEEDREVTETELELYSALDALQLLGKYHALFVDRTELTGKDGGAIPIELFGKTLKKVYGDDG